MAYLTENLSRQEQGVVANSGNIDMATGQPASSVSPAQVINEHGNFEIARKLNAEKFKLINGLSQFPVTALLVLNTHEKMADISEQDEEISLVSDLASALSDIKKGYVEANKALLAVGPNDPVYLQHKQNLVSALQAFPFSFEELKKITEVIVYAYKIRGLCYQPAQESNSKTADLIIKRLEGNKHRNRASVAKMMDLFKDRDVYDEQFLFLSRVEMHNYFAEIIIAEHRWLAARQQLAEANYKLVLFIANQYKAGFLDFEDLVQEGQTGLLKAVDRFDYRLGFQFSTYAGYWIRQAISRSLSRCERLVRVPCGQVANINKVYRAKNELMARTGLEPSVKELAEYTKLSSDDINMIMSISQTVMSLEGPENEEDAFAPIDFLEQRIFTHAFSSIADADLERLLGEAIDSLNSREAKVICSHFGVDTDKEMTLQEIGSELNLTRERVRQIQVMALNKIKLNFGQQLMCFL
ncbi:MAG: RNA polymerase sigma factor RpoD/SigA [Methylovulum sp.]|uniref:sigma-70 family RNA polymerase sigma factor n=1 Tax=Methylovulum sp. TaxID=1916980 RepID=UPI002614EEF4|nr:RNA polymerase sigma factor RpoD/SigA [Methylovulum sp.]MDD2723649.1 RNA polymerase sigma factor RpoD/SigA [Methylovulum sp.]MDD5123858.1 RNA polymerase sigma factor RpoD/SigA [Methylovulum sp.]